MAKKKKAEPDLISLAGMAEGVNHEWFCNGGFRAANREI